MSDWFPTFRKIVVTLAPRVEESAVFADSGLLGFDTVWPGDWFPTFRKPTVPSATRVEGSEEMKVLGIH